MDRALGVFHEHHRTADFLWNQCDGPLGRHGDMLVRSGDRAADHILVIDYIVGPDGLRKRRGWRRTVYKLMGKSTAPLRICPGFEWLDREPARTWVLSYEPPTVPSDWYFQYMRTRAERVYGPDPRATHQLVLPAMWTVEGDVTTLRAESPPEKSVPLVAVTSGKKDLPGHGPRMEFLRRLRAAGVPMHLFGRRLPAELSPGGEIASKSAVLRPARFALVIENHSEGDQYVSEKIWDALLCWCVPIYFGTGAVDRLIPPESFIRLPDLGDRGFECLREAIADPSIWNRRLPAIAEARRRALGELRLVEWARRELGW